MSRTILISTLIAAVVLALPAMAADAEPPMLSRGYSLKVKSGHTAEFEAAMKKQVDWYKKNNETWQWHTWQWETGANFGQFVFRSPGHRWKDMDDRAERSARARAYFMENVGPHLESMSAGIGKDLPGLSRWPETLTEVPMVSVLEFEIRYGMSEEFVHTIGKIHKAIQDSGWPMNYGWSVSISGGAVPTFYLVIPHKNWADMEDPEEPFWTMMEKALGRADSDTVRKSLRECVSAQRSALARFRPDLSYIPSTK